MSLRALLKFGWAVAAWVVALPVPGVAQEWTRFRGPNGSGVGHARDLAAAPAERDVRWRRRLPGAGHSSPVIWGTRAYVTVVDDAATQFLVVSTDIDSGEVGWTASFPYRPFPKHNFNSFASATPAVDAARVYVCWSTPEHYRVAAVRHDGTVAWERDLGPYTSQHGCGTSPVLAGARLIVGNEQDGESSVLALNAVDGTVAWSLPRKSTRVAYSTPVVRTRPGAGDEIVFNSQSHGIYAVDPANGRVNWEFPEAFDKRSVSSPVLAGDLVFGSCGSGGGGNFVTVVRAGDRLAGRKAELAYQVRKSAPYVPTALVVDGRAWLWSDAGVLTLMDAGSGNIHWQERVGGNYFGSPVWVSGRLYAVSTTGELVCVDGGMAFKVLGRFGLGETTHSTPAVAADRMFIHTERSLVCIGSGASGARR